MENLTHWKKLNNPNYLGAYAFQPNEEIILTIKNVVNEMVMNGDGKNEECIVCYFAEPNVKPLILNVTNCKTISSIYQTPYIENWKGKRIRLYVTSVRAFGDTVDAVRIRPIIPKETTTEKPVLNEAHPDWEKATAALQEGNASITALQKRFTIPPTELKQLEAMTHA